MASDGISTIDNAINQVRSVLEAMLANEPACVSCGRNQELSVEYLIDQRAINLKLECHRLSASQRIPDVVLANARDANIILGTVRRMVDDLAKSTTQAAMNNLSAALAREIGAIARGAQRSLTGVSQRALDEAREAGRAEALAEQRRRAADERARQRRLIAEANPPTPQSNPLPPAAPPAPPAIVTGTETLEEAQEQRAALLELDDTPHKPAADLPNEDITIRGSLLEM